MNEARQSALEEAMRFADAVASGDEDASRNRLRQLDEAVSKGETLSVEGMVTRLASRVEGQLWASIYTEHEQDIRASMPDLVKLTEGLDRSRFRVLASKHAPDNIEDYRKDVVESLTALVGRYAQIEESAGHLVVRASARVSWYTPVTDGLLASSVIGFVESLRESAAFLCRDGRAIMESESESGDLPRLARFHDLLADGLEDYVIALAFAETSIPAANGAAP